MANFRNSLGALERLLLQRLRDVPFFDTLSVDRSTLDFSYYVNVSLRLGPHHYRRTYTVTDSELMDHPSGARFVNILLEDLLCRSRRFAEEHADLVSFRNEYRRVFAQQLNRSLDQAVFNNFRTFRRVEDRSVENKAKALFMRVAGEEAFRILEDGKAIVLRGSAGGRYRMIKSFAYCVTDVQRGCDMCAVVPDVPLYDHLLGIKLTIEHNEPLFKATANVTNRTGLLHQHVMNPNRW